MLIYFMIFRMTERVNPFPTESEGFFALHKHFLNGLYAKNPPPRRTRRGPPPFERRSVPQFGVLFCVDSFYDFQNDGTKINYDNAL